MVKHPYDDDCVLYHHLHNLILLMQSMNDLLYELDFHCLIKLVGVGKVNSVSKTALRVMKRLLYNYNSRIFSIDHLTHHQVSNNQEHYEYLFHFLLQFKQQPGQGNTAMCLEQPYLNFMLSAVVLS